MAMNFNNYFLNSILDTEMKKEKNNLSTPIDVQMKLSAYKNKLQEISEKLDELILAAVEQYDLLDEKVRSLNAKRSKHKDKNRKN